MLSRRPPSSRRSWCPACDAPLPAERAADDQPRCPTCGEALRPMQVARGWRRAAAGLLDLAILAVTAGPLNWALLQVVDTPAPWGEATGLDALLRLLELTPAELVRPIIPFGVMSGLYLGLFWALTGRTPAQRLLGLRVVDARGRTPTPVWAAVRVLALGLGFLPGLLGWLWVGFDLERRAWHDHLARTWVVRDP